MHRTFALIVYASLLAAGCADVVASSPDPPWAPPPEGDCAAADATGLCACHVVLDWPADLCDAPSVADLCEGGRCLPACCPCEGTPGVCARVEETGERDVWCCLAQ